MTRPRDLIERSRVALAQWLGVPQVPPAPPSQPVHQEVRPVSPLRIQHSVTTPVPDPAAEDVLAGVCSGIALRDLNLVDTLLAQLEKMEAKEDDPDTLAELYRLDHLATRLRRNAENLRVLSGREASDEPAESTSLVDVVRAAMSPIEHYARVHIGQLVQLGVNGVAADDMGRLLAELLDNATSQSPPTAPVKVSAHLTEQGSILIRVEDEGIGLPPERLQELNERLLSEPVVDYGAVRHMGLAVVRRLAVRHGVRVWLAARTPQGTMASVLVPASLVCDLPSAISWSGSQTVAYQGQDAEDVPESAEPAPVPMGGRHRSGGYNSGFDGGGFDDEEYGFGSKSGNLDVAEDEPRRSWMVTTSKEPAPVVAVGGTTANGLPRRVPRSLRHPEAEPGARTPEPRPEPLIAEVPAPSEAPASPEVTAADVVAEPPVGENPGTSVVPDEPDLVDDHSRLLADLGAFAEGELAARTEQEARAHEAGQAQSEQGAHKHHDSGWDFGLDDSGQGAEEVPPSLNGPEPGSANDSVNTPVSDPVNDPVHDAVDDTPPADDSPPVDDSPRVEDSAPLDEAAPATEYRQPPTEEPHQ